MYLFQIDMEETWELLSKEMRNPKEKGKTMKEKETESKSMFFGYLESP